MSFCRLGKGDEGDEDNKRKGEVEQRTVNVSQQLNLQKKMPTRVEEEVLLPLEEKEGEKCTRERRND